MTPRDKLFKIEGWNFMNDVISRVEEALAKSHLLFSEKPILIGGTAMEYYGLRKAGKDMDWIITEDDWHSNSRNITRSCAVTWASKLAISICGGAFPFLITLFSSKVLWKPNISAFFPLIVFCG